MTDEQTTGVTPETTTDGRKTGYLLYDLTTGNDAGEFGRAITYWEQDTFTAHEVGTDYLYLLGIHIFPDRKTAFTTVIADLERTRREQADYLAMIDTRLGRLRSDPDAGSVVTPGLPESTPTVPVTSAETTSGVTPSDAPTE